MSTLSKIPAFEQAIIDGVADQLKSYATLLSEFEYQAASGCRGGIMSIVNAASFMTQEGSEALLALVNNSVLAPYLKAAYAA